MSLPTLAAVPSIVNPDLCIKATTSGITYLLKNKYRSRYTGSKRSAVDINGNLWLNANELQREISCAGEDNTKKKRFAAHEPQKKINQSEQQSYVDPITTTKKSYSVNKKEVRQRILAYLNSQRGAKELYFWTVSFPKDTSDAACYQAFNTWLTSLRKFRMLRDYIWVAERQQIGTIHFHIAIPHKMPVKKANAMMAGTLKTLSRKGIITASTYQCQRYNGVDIAKNRTTKRVTNFAKKRGSRALANYLTKYVTKNDGQFEHLAWHNSRGYSALFTGVTFTLPEFVKHGFGFFLNRTRVLTIGDFAKFIPWIGESPPSIADHLYKLNSYILENLN